LTTTDRPGSIQTVGIRLTDFAAASDPDDCETLTGGMVVSRLADWARSFLFSPAFSINKKNPITPPITSAKVEKSQELLADGGTTTAESAACT
jgi:hypothetical protein